MEVRLRRKYDGRGNGPARAGGGGAPARPVVVSAHARPGSPRGAALAQRIRWGGAPAHPGPRLRREYDGEGGG